MGSGWAWNLLEETARAEASLSAAGLELPKNRREHSIDSMAVIDVHVGGLP